MVVPGTDIGAAELTESEIEAGQRLAGVMFTLGKQQAALAHKISRTGGVDRAALMLIKQLVILGPSRSSALAAAVHSDPSTVSRQTAALVRDGLVERRADPDDGRASVLVPTEAGLKLLDEQRKRIGLALARVIRQWPHEDVDRFVELLERFAADHAANLSALINECAGPARSEGEK